MTRALHVMIVMAILLTVPLTAAGMVGAYVVALHVMAPTPKHFRPQPVHHVVTVKLTAT